jgi:Bacterial Ig domain
MFRKFIIGPLIAATLIFSLSPAAAFLRGGQAGPVATAPPTFTAAWESLKICCGGLLNSLYVARSDNTIIAATNTYGAYLRKTSGQCAGTDQGGWGTTYAAPCWEQLVTQTSTNLTLTQVTGLNQGVLEAVSCENNTSDAYMFFNGNLWVTTNLKAASASRVWAQTPLTTSIGGNQGINAGTGHTIVCDPANPNIVYAAVPGNLKVSSNGLSGATASFANVTGVGTTGAIPSIIAYDPTSATGTCAQFAGSPTCTLHFWVFTSGTGVYETYNGGSTFTLTSSGPTTAGNPCGQGGWCFRMSADQFGTMRAAIGDAKLYKYVPNGTAGGGTWSNSTPGVNNSQVAEFATDPTSGSAGTLRIAATASDGSLAVSTNGGSSWTAAGNNMAVAAPAGQPQWMGTANQFCCAAPNTQLSIAVQDLVFDTVGNLWTAAGIGVWTIASANIVANSNTWQADNIGIEQLVANWLLSPPGMPPAAAVWDRGIFGGLNPDIFPSNYFPGSIQTDTFGNVGQIEAAWAIDYASTAPNVIAGWIAHQGTIPGVSTDGGYTFSVFPAMASGTTNLGGAFAASTATNWLMVPGFNATLSYTLNAATSWTGPSTPTGFITPWINTEGVRIPIAADRVTANTYCMVDAQLNFFSSTTSTPAWTKVATGSAVDGVAYNDMLQAVPGNAGHFFYSGGNAGGSSTGLHLWKSTNTCANWTQLSLTNVYAFGFGAPKPGGSGYPAIYAYASLSGVQGFYESDDAGSTWALISAPAAAQLWASNSVDFVKVVQGDMNVYGRVYVGFNGSGYAYIDTTNACSWVDFSNTKPNASLTGTVTLQATASGKTQVVTTGVYFYVDGTLIGTQTTPSSGSGTAASPYVYSQSWNTGGVATGAHTLKVLATGNNAACTTGLAQGNSFSIPITTH